MPLPPLINRCVGALGLVALLISPALAQDAPSLDGDVIPAPPTPDALPPPPSLSIVYEGATGGLSGAVPDLFADEVVAAALAGDGDGTWTRRAAGWGAFHQDGRWLLQADGGVGRFRTQVAPSAAVAGIPIEARSLVADDYAVFVWPATDADRDAADATVVALQQALAADPLRARPGLDTVRLQQAAVADGLETYLVSRADASIELASPLDPDRWEARLRTVFQSPVATVFVVSRLQGEGARRFALIDGWPRQNRLYLAAGNSIEGRSYLEDAGLSLQRPNTWAAWTALGLDALAAGEAELLAGPSGLKAEADAAGVALLSANLVDGEGTALFDRWTIRDVDGHRVALIGWTDPGSLERLPPGVRNGCRARGAVAVHEAVAALAALPEEERPELTVLFGVGARELAGHLPGVTIVLGDFTTRLRLAPEVEVGAGALLSHVVEPPGGRAPALLSRLGPQYVGRIEVQFDGVAMTRLRDLRIRVDEFLPADPDQIAAVQSVRQGVYASREDVLVPDLGIVPWPERKAMPTPPADFDPGAYLQTAANLLMDRTGADLALLRPLPLPVDVPGPTAALFVDASLAVADEVSVIEVTGLQLRNLLAVVEARPPQAATPGWGAPEEPDGLWAWSAGLAHVGKKITVRGRIVQDIDVLYVATSSFFDQDPRVIAALGIQTRVWRSFAGDGWLRRRAGTRTGTPWSLHNLVRGGLEQLRALDPDFHTRYARALRPLSVNQAAHRAGRLTLEFDGLAFQITGSKGFGSRDGYANSQETRVNQADSFAASLRARVALVWDDRVGTVTGYARGTFGLNRIPEVDELIELEDDLEVGAVAALRLLEIPTITTASIPLSLFVQGAFDTEFTRGEAADGSKLDRQRIQRTTAGATFGKHLVFKEARAGVFLEYDFSAEVGPLAPGVNLSGLLEYKAGPFKTTGLADFKGYFRTPVDTDTDLAFTLQLRGDVGGMPFARTIPGLTLGGFVDALLFQGKLDSNEEVGMHLLIGAALSYDADLRPPLRLR